MKPEEFYALCDDRFSFLKEKYRFQTVSTTADHHSYIVLMENDTTGVEVDFEFENLYPRLYLYKVATLTQSTRQCIDLKEFLESRNPDLIYPTQKTEEFLHQMVKNVIAGKKTEATEYPENLDSDVVLSHYSQALQQTAGDVLSGNHQAFDNLPTFSQPVAAT